MKNFYRLLVILSLLNLTSCAVSKYTAPPFTDVDKILGLAFGQSVEDVNNSLKIKPYDVVYSHDKNKMLLIYNYRVKDRRMGLPTKNASQIIHSEEAQREGETWYNANYRELFVLFEGEKLKSFYGEEVLFGAEYLMQMESYLNGESKDDFVFASNVYQDRKLKKETELQEDEAAKKRRKIILLGGSVAALYVINLFLN